MPPPIATNLVATTDCRALTRPATTKIEAACPAATGARARSTAARLRSCTPLATASNQPMPGLRPWKAPIAASSTITGMVPQPSADVIRPVDAGRIGLPATPQAVPAGVDGRHVAVIDLEEHGCALEQEASSAPPSAC